MVSQNTAKAAVTASITTNASMAFMLASRIAALKMKNQIMSRTRRTRSAKVRIGAMTNSFKNIGSDSSALIWSGE